MVEPTAGKKLSAARLARGLSLDAAAHTTKMRPDRLLALENDDFTRFGSVAYAKSFLLMYARFLKVDVSAELHELNVADEGVNVREYQYLNNAPKAKEEVRMPLPRRKPKPPSILPLLAFVLFCLLGVGYLWVRVNIHRLGLDKSSDGQTVEVVTAKPPLSLASAPLPSAVPVEPVATAPEPPAANPGVAVAEPPAPEEYELSVEPLKKTLVTIRKDRNSPPLFEDYLYPKGGTFKTRGTTFFIEVRDETAVQIRKNGQPIAYQSPGIVVE